MKEDKNSANAHIKTTRILITHDDRNIEVTITNWHWMVYDWLAKERNWEMKDCLESVEKQDWETGFDDALSAYLEIAIDRFLAEESKHV